jgi:ubiquinone/menaquinone biosynthesis C-methylase UbiE
MTEQPQIRFDDGAAYERHMGVWSRKVGEVFLDWLNPAKNLDWIDVGCGNGAFTELLTERVSPHAILGIDPSDAQLTYARDRHTAGLARFETGDAMALPVQGRNFDAAVMALVVAFVPDPARGIAEMVRVTRPQGLVSAYMWDLTGGGFPLSVFYDELKAQGLGVLAPPSPEASRLASLELLWRDAGIGHIETRTITVERIYADFETLWTITLSGPRLAGVSQSMSEEQRDTLKAKVRAKLLPDADGRITATARANAIMGRVPGQAG